MNFSCDNCQRKYSIADERVGDKGVKIRCKHCQHVIMVKPPPQLASEESTRMVSLEELERGGVAARRSGPANGGGSGGGGAKPAKGGGGKSQRTEIGAPPEAPTTATSPGTASPWEGEATRAVVAPDPNAQWFAMVKGQQVGPFDLRGLSGKVKQGEVGLKTFVWREGMADWKRAEELPELMLIFAGGAAKDDRASQGSGKVEAMKSIAAALQKSASAGMRTSAPKPSRPGGEPLEEPKRVPVAEASPDEMWPAETADEPMAFDLSVDGLDVDAAVTDDDAPPLADTQDMDLMATAATLAEAAAAPVTPPPAAPAPAPAMSSAAAVSVTPGPTRRSPRKNKETPAPEPEPAPAPAPAADADLGSDLFSDLDLRRSGEHQRPIDPGDLTRTADEPAPNGAGGNGQAKGSPDPFSKMGKIPIAMLPKPGEATSHVIAEAGVDRRNPLWKIALFVVVLLGVPVGAAYALSELNVVPLQITHVDQATGETVTDKVFSKGGVSGLRDLLTGKRAAAATTPAAAAHPEKDAPVKVEKAPATGPAAKASEPNAKQLADLYQDDKKKDVGPAKLAPVAGDAKDQGKEEAVGGPPKEEINKVVEATQRAFQFCIEQELKKNPSFKGGKVRLVATVGASGVVKKAFIDREDINQSDLGECLKGKAKRMTFSAFQGDDVDLEIPLILSTTM